MTGALMGGGGGGGTSTTVTKQEFSPEEQAVRARIFAEGGGLYDQQKGSAGQYQGPGVVGFSQPSQEAFGVQTGAARAAIPTTMDALRSAAFNMNDARYVGSNPYAADAIRAALDPIVRQHATGTMPALRLGGAQTGTGMGTRQGVAEGLATEALYRTLANTSAQMASGMYNTGLNAAVTTQGQLPQIMSGVQAPAAMLSQVGTTLENQAQAEENVRAQGRLAAMNGPWDLLANYAGLASGMSNPTMSTTQTAPERSGLNPLQMIGSGMSILSMLKGFM